jgi:hypothetical protein
MEVMHMSSFVNRVVAWLNEGYPNDVPRTDHVPLVALLTREFSPESTLVAE